jgi:hypothetical protein
MKGRGDKAGCPADEFIGRARKQLEKPVLVGRIYREDIYQDDHAVPSSLLLPEALPSRICRLSVAAMNALLALARDRPAAFTTQPISREFDEAGVKRDRHWSEELREREHVRNRPTRLLRPIRLRRIANGNEE